MRYYVDVIKTNKNNATLKAPGDIAKICDELGMTAFNMPNLPYDKSVYYQKAWMLLVWQRYWHKLLKKMKSGDVLLYQHPMYGTRIMEKILPKFRQKGVKIVMLIHDLNILRGGETFKRDKTSSVYIQDMIILNYADNIICHNKSMLDYLVSEGFSEDKLTNLEIFDYLTDYRSADKTFKKEWSCVIAGNLVKAKCKYIYDLIDRTKVEDAYKLHLYGGGLEVDLGDEYTNVVYHGSISPEKLPEVMEGDFGIVWDGTSTKSCEGNNGNYLRYNNPHKTSLFLASGVPVIVWKEAALAEFVEQNGVGFTVSSLEEINGVLSKMTEAEYTKMIANVDSVSEKIRNGYFFKNAYQKAENAIFSGMEK